MDSVRQKHANADETRKAIFEAALEEFALRSVNGARTREIAKKANVNHAAINYHFGGKHEMYAHIIRDIIQHFSELFAPLLAESEELFKTEPDNKKKALDLIKRILMLYHSFYYHPSFSNFWLLAKREEIFPSEAFDTVFRDGFKPFHQNFVKLVDIAGGFSKSKKENAMIAIALLGLNASLVSCRIPFLKINRQTELTKDDIDMFRQLVINAVDKVFK